ncbi:MAG: methyltransferase domain-containing protein [Alphaproteobacteria bacterium]|nr:MAG: methyltransferase domain-containing protein [Alphaproteobacteria bacterium]
MHRESKLYMKSAFERHAAPRGPGRVLDVGASGKRPFFRELWEGGGWHYDGLDLAAGPNIDIVLDDPWKFPIEDDSYDAVISGQMLEHNEFFWLTFLEMARVLKMGGLMIHIAPSRGLEHRDPQDCWRFYRDGMTAMAKWAGLDCIEATTDWAPEHFAYIDRFPKHAKRARHLRRTMRSAGTDWGDTVGVFVKTTDTARALGMDYIRAFAARFPQAET